MIHVGLPGERCNFCGTRMDNASRGRECDAATKALALTEHEHVWEFGSWACVTCGHVEQMTFEDVVESEVVVGDAEYTAWLKAGRPKLDKNVSDNAR